MTDILNCTKSEEIFSAAQELMTGGVSSPVRAFKSVGGQTIDFDRVKGPFAWDIDGNRYIDYIGSWGPAICGHAHPEVTTALQEAIEKGTSFGAPCVLENKLAEMVINAVPSVEMVRFVNSGTEACMAVLRLMRAFTGRDKVIKFDGCYHGHADMFLVKAGSGVATLGLPDSPGVPRTTTVNTLTAPYNDLEAVKKLFSENPDAISGVILEPIVGNAGFITPEPGFLEGLREITTENGSLLVFDEVMTGFRISYGGAQEKFGVTPIPDAAYVIEYVYYKFPDDLSAYDDTMIIPDRFKYIIIDGGMVYMKRFRSNEQSAQIHQQKFTQGIKTMRRLLLDDPISVRSTMFVKPKYTSNYLRVDS